LYNANTFSLFFIFSGVISKNLTDNYHYHTIIAENENIFKEVEDKLKELGILLEE